MHVTDNSVEEVQLRLEVVYDETECQLSLIHDERKIHKKLY